MKTKGLIWFVGTVIIAALLSINDMRYATQLPDFWVVLFSLCWLCIFVPAGKKKIALTGISVAASLVLLVPYVNLLPAFTYNEAVCKLQEYYRQENFTPELDKAKQMLALHVENGEVTYYCYVAEANGTYYYFDQYDGSHGIVVTNPNGAGAA